MPPISKITKEDIINASVEITRKKGIEKVQARTIAKKLNCSTQPIFSKFSNMEEIKQLVLERAKEIHKEYMLKENVNIFEYRKFGKNYIGFAKQEPHLFRLLFMNSTDLTIDDLLDLDGSYFEISKVIERQTTLKEEKIRKFHLRMWIYTHGLACFIVNNVCDLSDEKIDELLFAQYASQMLLEEEFGNIPKGYLSNQLKKMGKIYKNN